MPADSCPRCWSACNPRYVNRLASSCPETPKTPHMVTALLPRNAAASGRRAKKARRLFRRSDAPPAPGTFGEAPLGKTARLLFSLDAPGGRLDTDPPLEIRRTASRRHVV